MRDREKEGRAGSPAALLISGLLVTTHHKQLMSFSSLMVWGKLVYPGQACPHGLINAVVFIHLFSGAYWTL